MFGSRRCSYTVRARLGTGGTRADRYRHGHRKRVGEVQGRRQGDDRRGGFGRVMRGDDAPERSGSGRSRSPPRSGRRVRWLGSIVGISHRRRGSRERPQRHRVAPTVLRSVWQIRKRTSRAVAPSNGADFDRAAARRFVGLGERTPLHARRSAGQRRRQPDSLARGHGEGQRGQRDGKSPVEPELHGCQSRVLKREIGPKQELRSHRAAQFPRGYPVMRVHHLPHLGDETSVGQ
mmetsp:Transcript_8682/g.39410  ORF Transcript_8682/g.39410 Transcript_8682/m.39410 type:complete len:234 (+) Transcript_8682:595-1296(+)